MEEKATRMKEAEELFTIITLDNGRAVEDLNGAINAIALDIRNRPHVAAPRKVSFELTLTPKDGFIHVKAQAKPTFPYDNPRKTMCGMPDENGNLRNLNRIGTGQKTLPIYTEEEN